MTNPRNNGNIVGRLAGDPDRLRAELEVAGSGREPERAGRAAARSAPSPSTGASSAHGCMICARRWRKSRPSA